VPVLVLGICCGAHGSTLASVFQAALTHFLPPFPHNLGTLNQTTRYSVCGLPRTRTMATVIPSSNSRQPLRHLAAFFLFLLLYVHPNLPVSASSGPPAAPIEPGLNMAHIPNYEDDPDFGTREEDWPDPDVDSSTEEGAEIMRRVEAAMEATMVRESRKRQQQWEQRRQATFRGIPEALYDKARDHQDQLTQEERQHLLSRGDLIGKALADRKSLTIDESAQVLQWPPVPVMVVNIKRATGGTGRVISPIELFDKARDALARGEFETAVNDEETALLALFFHGPDDPTFNLYATMSRINPGVAGGKAYRVVANALGVDDAVRCAAMRRMSERPVTPPPPAPPSINSPGPFGALPPAPPMPDPEDDSPAARHARSLNSLLDYQKELLALEEQNKARLRAAREKDHPPVNLAWTGMNHSPLSDADLFGAGPWPHGERGTGAFRVFQRDGLRPGSCDSRSAWHALGEDQKAVHRARAEALRREAWAEVERSRAAGDPTAPKPFGSLTEGFEAFHDNLGAGVRFEEALRGWDGLTAGERTGWAWAANRAEREAREARKAAWYDAWKAGERPGGRRRYEDIAEWRAKRDLERAAARGGAPTVQDAVSRPSGGGPVGEEAIPSSAAAQQTALAGEAEDKAAAGAEARAQAAAEAAAGAEAAAEAA